MSSCWWISFTCAVERVAMWLIGYTGDSIKVQRPDSGAVLGQVDGKEG